MLLNNKEWKEKYIIVGENHSCFADKKKAFSHFQREVASNYNNLQHHYLSRSLTLPSLFGFHAGSRRRQTWIFNER